MRDIAMVWGRPACGVVRMGQSVHTVSHNNTILLDNCVFLLQYRAVCMCAFSLDFILCVFVPQFTNPPSIRT